MNHDLTVLLYSAVFIGFIHTLAGPDHYLPFILLGKARHWSTPRTLWITAICGVGHVLGSALLGIIGIGLGLATGVLEQFENTRGTMAAWLLIAFGLAYLIWGLRAARRGNLHAHEHIHSDGESHMHLHSHRGDHTHAHLRDGQTHSKITPWALFIIFVLGPCEFLIPLLIVPASQAAYMSLLYVVLVFGLSTVGTMTTIVWLGIAGIRRLDLSFLGDYTHVIAGALLAVSGIVILGFGL